MSRKLIVFVSEGNRLALESPLLKCCKILLGRGISIINVAEKEQDSYEITVSGDPFNIEIARFQCEAFAFVKCGLAA